MEDGDQKESGGEFVAEGNFIILEDKDYETLLSEAAISTQKRAIRLLHKHGEHAHKMINAILPDSYLRPHKHENHHQAESFTSLKGKAELIFFRDNGEIDERVLLEGNKVVLVPVNKWHTVVTQEPCVLYIVKGQPEGGYNEATDKILAPWAPEELSDEGTRYLQDLKLRLGL